MFVRSKLPWKSLSEYARARVTDALDSEQNRRRNEPAERADLVELRLDPAICVHVPKERTAQPRVEAASSGPSIFRPAGGPSRRRRRRRGSAGLPGVEALHVHGHGRDRLLAGGSFG